jgi:RNA polymerase sigma-54 factor
MVTKLQLSPRLDQRLMISQQLKQAITLLQYSTVELTQVIKQYIDSNPMIEVVEENEEKIDVEADYNNEAGHYTALTVTKKTQSYDNNESSLENYSVKENLREHLFQQTLLCHFNPRQQTIAEAIINAIEDNGRLVISNEEIQRVLEPELITTVDEIDHVLNFIKTFDPPGVGARSISECLLIQLHTKTPKDAIWELAKYILVHSKELGGSFSDTKKWLNKIKITQDDYTKAIALIRTLHLDPGLEFLSGEENFIEPELYMKKIGSKWKVFLIDKFYSKLKLNAQ